MLKIAIVEDDINYAQQLKDYLVRYQQERGQEMEVTAYSDGDGLLEDYRSQFDVILMDVEMPFIDGMTAAREIRKVDSEVVIIFITNMAQYAIKGYAVDAMDYVLKPISYFAFSQRLERAIGRMKKRETKYIMVTTKGGTQKLDVSQLYYVESQGHSLLFHTSEGELVSTGTMQELEGKLEQLHFCRGNKGYLINLAHVDSVRDGCAIVHGTALALSRPRRNAFLEALTTYVGETVK